MWVFKFIKVREERLLAWFVKELGESSCLDSPVAQTPSDSSDDVRHAAYPYDMCILPAVPTNLKVTVRADTASHCHLLGLRR